MYTQLENEIRKTIALEVKGDSMNNGTRSSFEAGDRLIVKPFSIDDFRNNISNDPKIRKQSQWQSQLQ